MELGEWMPTQAGCSCSAHHALLDPAAILDISCAAASPLQIARRELAWHNGVLMALEQRTQQHYGGSCNAVRSRTTVEAATLDISCAETNPSGLPGVGWHMQQEELIALAQRTQQHSSVYAPQTREQ